MKPDAQQSKTIRVAEMFAGIGGFRLGLCGHEKWGVPGAGMQTVWANQWEPPGSAAKQFAWRCYEKRFGDGSCVNAEVETVLDDVERGAREIPAFDLLCGGFPCQDYSVAKPAAHSRGIEGKKGVLWWQIERLIRRARPHYVLLENVDRLLKSPSGQRGRDFAIILNCLNAIGYSIEWRVVDASAYGFPQRRKRVFVYGERTDASWLLEERLASSGVLAQAFRVHPPPSICRDFSIDGSLLEVSQTFGAQAGKSPFGNAGVMQNGLAVTANVEPAYNGPRFLLGDILLPDEEVDPSFYIHTKDLERWLYLKGAKREQRVCRRNGHVYTYSEGKIAFPDFPDAPSRTILTGEGGRAASRTKHVVETHDGRLRRLHPIEIERLFGFPDDWTNTGMSDTQRAFCLGNALVVGVVRRIGEEIARCAA